MFRSFSSFLLKSSPSSSSSSFFIIPYRFKAGSWPADHVQLYVSEYQHSSPLDHAGYQVRRLKYAKKGLVAPRVNDGSSDSEDITNILDETFSEFLNKKDLSNKFKTLFKESLRDYKREQEIAKDDPRSPFYFSDEEKAKQNAIDHAIEAAVGKLEQIEFRNLDGRVSAFGKTKILTDITPKHFTRGDTIVSNYVPEPEPVTYPEWDPYVIDFTIDPTVDSANTMDKLPQQLPKWRKSKIDKFGFSTATGGRKEAKAVASIKRGEGKIIVNNLPFLDYFPMMDARESVLAPLLVTETLLDFDIILQVKGGGKKGQAGAARLAISRALEKYDPSFRLVLKRSGLLRRDPRVVERKKPGRPKARKGFQWVKR